MYSMARSLRPTWWASTPSRVPRPDMLGIYLQDLTVELFRLRQAPRLMVLHGQVERLSNREHECLLGAAKGKGGEGETVY